MSDVAQIRGSAAFASGVQSFLYRALQLNSSHSYASADDALFDAREVANELSSHPRLTSWLATDELIRKLVAAIDNIAEGESPRPHLRPRALLHVHGSPRHDRPRATRPSCASNPTHPLPVWRL